MEKINSETNTINKYINNLQKLHTKLERVPMQQEFIAAKLGYYSTIKKVFGSWDNFLKKADLTYDIDDFNKDADRLLDILSNFSLYPIEDSGKKGHPLPKLIFCNILADHYSELREPSETNGGFKKISVLRELLGYLSNNSIRYHLRDGAVGTMKGYREYEHKYLVCKECFKNNNLYEKLKELEEIKNKANEEMFILMKDIIK